MKISAFRRRPDMICLAYGAGVGGSDTPGFVDEIEIISSPEYSVVSSYSFCDAELDLFPTITMPSVATCMYVYEVC